MGKFVARQAWILSFLHAEAKETVKVLGTPLGELLVFTPAGELFPALSRTPQANEQQAQAMEAQLSKSCEH